MNPQTFTTLVHTLQTTVVTCLIFLAGLSSCLSLWLIPLTKLLPPKLAAAQFQQTFVWGGQYLQPSSRALGFSLLLTTFLTSRLPDAAEAQMWVNWLVCFGILIPVAPYEIWFIFPINARVREIGEELERNGGREEEVKRELQVLLGKWQWRNFGRVGVPLVAGVVGMLNLVYK